MVLNSGMYFAMLVLGFYFIYQGGVVQRFLLKRANFASYEARMDELPTIVTWIYPYEKNVSFGQDFKLYFSSQFGSEEEIEVTFGENVQRVNGNDFRFNFQRYYQGFSALNGNPNLFKITPQAGILGNRWYPSEWTDSAALNLRFVYTNASQMSGAQFGLSLSTENNTASCKGRHFDGDVDFLNGDLNTYNKLTIFAQKYIYLPETRRCRHKPYIEILIENMNRNIDNKCKYAVPCKPKGSLEFVLHFA